MTRWADGLAHHCGLGCWSYDPVLPRPGLVAATLRHSAPGLQGYQFSLRERQEMCNEKCLVTLFKMHRWSQVREGNPWGNSK